MDRRPTLILLAITLTGASGAHWMLRTPLDQENTTPQTLLADTASKLQDRPEHLLSDAVSNNHIAISDQPKTLKRSTSVETLNTLYEPSYKPDTSFSDNPSPTNIPDLLRQHGIELGGIDQNSSHADALFSMFFEQSSTETTRAMELIIGDWAKTQPAQAWHWIQNNDATGVLNQYRKTILHHWLPLDADAALLAITHLETSNEKVYLLGDYAAFVARDNPEQAFYWAYGLTEHNSRQHALDRVVYEWAAIDAEQVILHLTTAIDPKIRQQMLLQAGPAITSKLTQTDPYQAMLWTSSLDQHENEYLSPIAFQQWVNRNPQEAMQWLVTERDYNHYELYMQSAANTLAYKDLSIAMDTFPNMSTEVQEVMASSIAISLYKIDPNNAKLWSNNLLDLETQRSAKRGILLASVDTDPVFALQTAFEYQGQDKDSVLIDTAIEVDQQHPDIMRDWLISAPLNESQRINLETALLRAPAE